MSNQSSNKAYAADKDLGWKIHEHLVSLGVETPYTPTKVDKSSIQAHFSRIMQELGMDLSDDSLSETPRRLAKLYTSEFCSGLDYDTFPKSTVVSNKFKYDEMLLERNIQVRSLCEHHFLPIVGSAFVAYIPNEKVVGLSKLNRIVDFFCRRPQIQERLTAQIFHTLSFILDTDTVAVVIDASHMCVKLRGVEDPCSDTVTSMLGGGFRNAALRAEFLSLCKGLNQ